jgi:phage terminase small subunit
MFVSMTEDLAEEEIQVDGFTVKQRRFIEEFCVDGNRTKAAIRAGYSPESAYSIGSENLKKPEIKAAVDARMLELSLPAQQVIKRISDNARTRLNDYLKVEKRQRKTQIPQSLHDAIAETESKLWFEEEFLARSIVLLGLDEDAAEVHRKEFWAKVGTPLKLQVLRWRMELEEDPDAFRSIEGPPEEYEVVEVDMIGLARAKEEGSIKSLSFNEFGPKVEMYAADGALRDLGRVHGIFEKDNRQAAGTEVIIIGGDDGAEAT